MVIKPEFSKLNTFFTNSSTLLDAREIFPKYNALVMGAPLGNCSSPSPSSGHLQISWKRQNLGATMLGLRLIPKIRQNSGAPPYIPFRYSPLPEDLAHGHHRKTYSCVFPTNPAIRRDFQQPIVHIVFFLCVHC